MLCMTESTKALNKIRSQEAAEHVLPRSATGHINVAKTLTSPKGDLSHWARSRATRIAPDEVRDSTPTVDEIA